MEVFAQWYCPVCPKSFGLKGDLTRHKLLHTGIKRHVCTICKKAFSQYSGLKTHRNVHTKVKPFVCGFNSCSASFGDPSSCARHRKETHRLTGAYRCPHPLCNSSIKRRSAFAAHLRKHDIDITYVDIDAMAPPFPPVAVSVPKRESVQEIMVVDITSTANESTLHQISQHQTSIPWTHYEDSGVMAGPSVLSVLPNFPFFDYDNISVGSLFAVNSSSRLDSPGLVSLETTVLPGEPVVVKTEPEMMANVPRTSEGIQISSTVFKGSALAYPFSHSPTYAQIYPNFKPLALP